MESAQPARISAIQATKPLLVRLPVAQQPRHPARLRVTEQLVDSLTGEYMVPYRILHKKAPCALRRPHGALGPLEQLRDGKDLQRLQHPLAM